MAREEQMYLHIVISQTATRFGYLLRKVGKVKYNHAAVALDSNLDEMYSFARKQQSAALLGGLVHESVERYTLRKKSDVQVVIFRIPVTGRQYEMARKMIRDIENDREYMYNLLSVLTWPLTKGFGIYKAYSCIEFTMTLLEQIGYTLSKPPYQYTPDDLLELFSDTICFQGNLLDYKKDAEQDDNYFLAISFQQVLQSCTTVKELMKRTLLSRTA